MEQTSNTMDASGTEIQTILQRNDSSDDEDYSTAWNVSNQRNSTATIATTAASRASAMPTMTNKQATTSHPQTTGTGDVSSRPWGSMQRFVSIHKELSIQAYDDGEQITDEFIIATNDHGSDKVPAATNEIENSHGASDPFHPQKGGDSDHGEWSAHHSLETTISSLLPANGGNEDDDDVETLERILLKTQDHAPIGDAGVQRPDQTDKDSKQRRCPKGLISHNLTGSQTSRKQKHRKPRGRPPAGHVWDTSTGKWVPDQQDKDHNKDVHANVGPPETQPLHKISMETTSNDDDEARSDHQPRKHKSPYPRGNEASEDDRNSNGNYPKPRGRPPSGYEWDHETGQWIRANAKKGMLVETETKRAVPPLVRDSTVTTKSVAAGPENVHQPNKQHIKDKTSRPRIKRALIASRKHPKPRGRPPAGHKWDPSTGQWVQLRTSDKEPWRSPQSKCIHSPHVKEATNHSQTAPSFIFIPEAVTKKQGIESVATLDHQNSRTHSKPRGRPPTGHKWDHISGQWIMVPNANHVSKTPTLMDRKVEADRTKPSNSMSSTTQPARPVETNAPSIDKNALNTTGRPQSDNALHHRMGKWIPLNVTQEKQVVVTIPHDKNSGSLLGRENHGAEKLPKETEGKQDQNSSKVGESKVAKGKRNRSTSTGRVRLEGHTRRGGAPLRDAHVSDQSNASHGTVTAGSSTDHEQGNSHVVGSSPRTKRTLGSAPPKYMVGARPSISPYTKVSRSSTHPEKNLSNKKDKALTMVLTPKHTPKVNSDGTFAKPRGREPAGYLWDENIGKWVTSIKATNVSTFKAGHRLSVAARSVDSTLVQSPVINSKKALPKPRKRSSPSSKVDSGTGKRARWNETNTNVRSELEQAVYFNSPNRPTQMDKNGLFRSPRGRRPTGCVWDPVKGMWRQTETVPHRTNRQEPKRSPNGKSSHLKNVEAGRQANHDVSFDTHRTRLEPTVELARGSEKKSRPKSRIANSHTKARVVSATARPSVLDGGKQSKVLHETDSDAGILPPKDSHRTTKSDKRNSNLPATGSVRKRVALDEKDGNRYIEPITAPEFNIDGTFKRPRGRGPENCIWDETIGKWRVDDSTPVQRNSSPERRHRRIVEDAVNDERPRFIFPNPPPMLKRNGKFKKPMGTDPQGYAWDSRRGLWVAVEVTETAGNHRHSPHVDRNDSVANDVAVDDIPNEADNDEDDDDQHAFRSTKLYVACGHCNSCRKQLDCGRCLHCVNRSLLNSSAPQQCAQRVCTSPVLSFGTGRGRDLGFLDADLHLDMKSMEDMSDHELLVVENREGLGLRAHGSDADLDKGSKLPWSWEVYTTNTED